MLEDVLTWTNTNLYESHGSNEIEERIYFGNENQKPVCLSVKQSPSSLVLFVWKQARGNEVECVGGRVMKQAKQLNQSPFHIQIE